MVDIYTAVDDFSGESTDVALTDHVGEIGAVWTQHPGARSVPNVSAEDNNLYIQALSYTRSAAIASGETSSADYIVGADVSTDVFDGHYILGVMGRASATHGTFYLGVYRTRSLSWRIYKYVAGVSTILGDYAADVFTSEIRRVELSLRGSQISLLVDGDKILSVTDASISGPGHSGVYVYNENPAMGSAIHIDNFSAKLIIPETPQFISTDCDGCFTPYIYFNNA